MGPKEAAVESEFSALSQKLDNELQSVIQEKLPAAAVRMDGLLAKCSANFSLPQRQEDGTRPDERLVLLVEEMRPVFVETTMDLHLVESKLRRMISDVKLSAEVLVGEVVDRSLKLAEGLRRELEDELAVLNNFHTHRSYHLRKMLKCPAQGDSPLREYDQRVQAMMRVSLAKSRNLCIALHDILSDNLEHLTRARTRRDPHEGAPHSMLYY